MLKLIAKTAAVAFAVAGVPTVAVAQLGPDAAACRSGDRPAVLVNVDGFYQRTGNVRVAIYNNPSTFLERGATLRKIDVPVTRAGPMRICVAVPRTGNYAIAVRHDVDGNGRSGWSDGGGFSRNPRVSLTNLRPRYQNVAINVGPRPVAVNVVLNYRFGFSIRPVRGGSWPWSRSSRTRGRPATSRCCRK
jgi:uncharacterized protein (DUF2141 family)